MQQLASTLVESRAHKVPAKTKNKGRRKSQTREEESIFWNYKAHIRQACVQIRPSKDQLVLKHKAVKESPD